MNFLFFFQAEDGIRDLYVTGVQTCALPISRPEGPDRSWEWEMSDPWDGSGGRAARSRTEIGRASCRERVSKLVGEVAAERHRKDIRDEDNYHKKKGIKNE